MSQDKIKVYARLKKESKAGKLVPYEVVNKSNEDLLKLYGRSTKNIGQKFRFNKVFDVNASQKQLFEIIAKPIINGVLSGYNGTIFAYGPTGSGKTYSLTGSYNKYQNRGLIPRAIEYIFKDMANSENEYAVYISYLEIYNEIAYDLLNPKECISSIEELPRVALLEDDKGEAHYKNLSLRPVHSEAEAMELLFLGDSNRTTAETPINVYSSRSHCIFSIHITAKNKETYKIRKSKLNLVDLAGSERIFKTNLNGITLSEAKYINLSLYYLEQVILAISESKRGHVPFRNSIMTFMLRDSLAGHSLTSMLTTLSVERDCLDETLSACKFAQRVSMIKMSTVIHNDIDPHVEIATLRMELMEMHKKCKLLERDDKPLTKGEQNECKQWVQRYLNGVDESPLAGKAKVKYCCTLLRDEIKEKSKQDSTLAPSIELKYKQIIQQREEEISILLSTINNVAGSKNLLQKSSVHILNKQKANMEGLFNEYMIQTDSKKTLACCINCINEMYSTGRSVASKMIEHQINIQNLKRKLRSNELDPEAKKRFRETLKEEQYLYKKMLLKLSHLKSDIDYMRNSMTRTKIRILIDFKKWLLCKNLHCSPGVVQKIDARIERYLKQINSQIVGEQIEYKAENTITEGVVTAKISGPCLAASCLREIQNVIESSVATDKPTPLKQPYKSFVAPSDFQKSNSKALLSNPKKIDHCEIDTEEIPETDNDICQKHISPISNECGPYYIPSNLSNLGNILSNSKGGVCETPKADNLKNDLSKEYNVLASTEGNPRRHDRFDMNETFKTDKRNDKSKDSNMLISNNCGPYYTSNISTKSEHKITYGDVDIFNKDSLQNNRGNESNELFANKCGFHYSLSYLTKSKDKMTCSDVCESDSEENLKTGNFRNDKCQMGSLLGSNINFKSRYLNKCTVKNANESRNGLHEFKQASSDYTITESGDDQVQNNSVNCMASASSTNDLLSGDGGGSKEVEFLNFMKTVPMTGDADVDEEIIKFYKMKLLS